MGMTLVVSFASFIFSWMVALPIGVLSAVRQYSLADYFFSFIGFIGMATPGFLLALVLMYLAFKYGGVSLSGLFSTEFQNAPWSFAKVARPAQASLDSDDHRRHGGHCRTDPHHARQPARRTEQTLCRDCARQRNVRMAAADQVSAAARAQSRSSAGWPGCCPA